MTERPHPARLAGILSLALLLGAGLSCSRTGDEGPAAPDIVLRTLDDTGINLADRHGRPALVVFFSITNPLALDELERLEALAEGYGESGLELIAVAPADERPELVRTIVHQRRFLFPVAMDPEGAAAAAVGDITATPTVLLVSPAGRIVMRQEGRSDTAALRARIAAF